MDFEKSTFIPFPKFEKGNVEGNKNTTFALGEEGGKTNLSSNGEKNKLFEQVDESTNGQIQEKTAATDDKNISINMLEQGGKVDLPAKNKKIEGSNNGNFTTCMLGEEGGSPLDKITDGNEEKIEDPTQKKDGTTNIEDVLGKLKDLVNENKDKVEDIKDLITEKPERKKGNTTFALGEEGGGPRFLA